jgi:cytochrome c oxidase subunit 4
MSSDDRGAQSEQGEQAEQAEQGEQAENGLHHVIPFKTYIQVFAALIGLTIVTVSASRIDFGAWNTVIAFAIASIKAVLVLGYFMHLKYDNMLNRAIIASAVFFLIVLYFFCALDEGTRVIQRSTL